ncbi:hypothetical protein [Aliarcobacter cryaerophilus]|uniref:hypothetical protein n=1 Tax=Aliarcobacter cryaerophilus TaxID=28198 RepID=UPI003DA41E6C
MKNLLLIALLMLGLMFNGCASKSETGINQENSMSFGADLVQSGNPIGMAIGGLVMLLTVDGLEQTGMKEQYNTLSQQQKETYIELMKPCMLSLHRIEMDKRFEGKKLSDEDYNFYYNNEFILTLRLETLDKPFRWQKGIKNYSVYRDQCHPQSIKEILGEQTQTAPVSEIQETTENQTTQNQTSILNNDEKVEEKQENNN